MIDMYIPIFEAKVERIRQKIRELESSPNPDTRVIICRINLLTNLSK